MAAFFFSHGFGAFNFLCVTLWCVACFFDGFPDLIQVVCVRVFLIVFFSAQRWMEFEDPWTSEVKCYNRGLCDNKGNLHQHCFLGATCWMGRIAGKIRAGSVRFWNTQVGRRLILEDHFLLSSSPKNLKMFAPRRLCHRLQRWETAFVGRGDLRVAEHHGRSWWTLADGWWCLYKHVVFQQKVTVSSVYIQI